MAYKTKLTNNTESLVAYHTIKRSFDIMAKRADRKVKPLATQVYDRLVKKQKFSKDSPVIADYRFEDKDKARTLSEGIKEFSQRFPKQGEKLQSIIKETRKTKKRYLQFGINPDTTYEGSTNPLYGLPQEVYVSALKDIGIPSANLENTLSTVMDISDMLYEKRQEGLSEMLIK